MTEREHVRWRDWVTVFACLVCQIGMGVGGYIFPVFLKPVVAELNWSRTTYASANPIMSTLVAAAGPVVGWASDRVGPRPVLAIGSVGMGCALVAAGAMQSTTQWYLIAALVGISVACLGDLPTGAAVAARFRNNRGLALSLVYIGSNIGGALVPLVGTALAEGASWRVAFRTIGMTLTLVLLPFALLVDRPRVEDAPHEETGTDDGGPAWFVLRRLDFWLLFWVLFAFYFYRLGVNVHLVAFLSDLGYSEAEAAGSFSLTVGLGIAGKLLAGSVADRIGVRPAVIGNFIVIAFASTLLLVPHVPGAIVAFLVVHGASTAAEDVVVPLLIGQRFGSQNLARVYGWLLLALIPGGSFGPLLAGRIFDATGSYAYVFAIFFVCNVLAVVALALVARSKTGVSVVEVSG